MFTPNNYNSISMNMNDEYAFSLWKIVILIIVPKVILLGPNYYNCRYWEKK